MPFVNHEEEELIRIGPGTPSGGVFRRWNAQPTWAAAGAALQAPTTRSGCRCWASTFHHPPRPAQVLGEVLNHIANQVTTIGLYYNPVPYAIANRLTNVPKNR